MREEVIMHGGLRVTSVYHPNVPMKVCPKIVDQETRDGVKHYVDSAGGRHVAEIFDRIWGTRQAILPKQKGKYQRIRKM